MLPSPGQQRAQLVDFGFARDDAFEDIAQISERLDIVELCRLDQRGNNRPAFGPAIRTGEEMVLGAQLDRPDGALDGIRINLDAPVFEEHTEPLPMAQRIADRLGQVGFGRNAGEFLLEPGLHGVDQWCAPGLAEAGPVIGRAAADARLDLVEFGDPPQRLGGDRRAGRMVEVEELAPDMSPAEGKFDRAYTVEPRIAVDLQYPGDLGHKTTAARSWCGRARDRAPEPACRRRRSWARRGSSPVTARPAGAATSRHARPSSLESNGRDRCRGGQRSAPDDRAADDRCTWPPAPGPTPLRWRCPQSAAVPVLAPAPPHPRSCGTRNAAVGSP